jgi:hypothetical protein
VPWTVGVPKVCPHKGRKGRINDQKGKGSMQEHNQRRRYKGGNDEIRLEIRTTYVRNKGEKEKEKYRRDE